MTTSVSLKLFDQKRFEEDFFISAERVFKQAAVEFVRTAASNVPSLTGQAKSALIHIAESLGVDPGVTPDSPPISENIELKSRLEYYGNTVRRGKTLSKAEIVDLKTKSKLIIKFNIFSAHNNFGYFTWWDNTHWHSIEEAEESMRRYIASNFQPPELRVKNG